MILTKNWILTKAEPTSSHFDEMSTMTLTTFTGETKQMKMSLSPNELHAGVEQYNSGAYIQDAFPKLSPDEREFLMTGMTSEDWAATEPED